MMSWLSFGGCPKRVVATPILGAGLLVAGCGDASPVESHAKPMAEALFVARPGGLASYDIASGKERPGEVQDVTSPVDLQALADGTVMVNLTEAGEILIVDGKTMLEKARIPSSRMGAKRPVHSFITPPHEGKTYWVTANDGTSGAAKTNSALFLDVTPGSKTYLEPVGEVSLGIGHHKMTFSARRARVAVSNIADCANVIGVYDYTNPGNIKTVLTLSAKDLGWDGSSFARTCDTTFQMGVPPSPHGCATARSSGKAYCNLTGSGDIVALDIDADPPFLTVLPTTGSGAGYTRAHPGGRYVYSLQATPREGDAKQPGAKCQIGQLVVIDAESDSIAATVPLFYDGPSCTSSLMGTDEETDEPGHILVSENGKTLFIGVAGGFGVDEARARRELIIDVSNPAKPVQRASVVVGASKGHHGDTLSGDGKSVFVTNTVDGTVSRIDTATLKVIATLDVKDGPVTVATFGQAEGPSEQTGPIP